MGRKDRQPDESPVGVAAFHRIVMPDAAQSVRDVHYGAQIPDARQPLGDGPDEVVLRRSRERDDADRISLGNRTHRTLPV
jgi:hypothetical protein